jgi:hypothetical protein
MSARVLFVSVCLLAMPAALRAEEPAPAAEPAAAPAPAPGSAPAPATTPAPAAAATPTTASAPRAHDLLRARLAEEAKPGAAKPNAPVATEPPKSETARAIVEGRDKPAAAPAASTASGSTAEEVRKQPAEVLPKVEVKKRRITVLDQQLAKEDQLIAREKQNTKPGELDKALNDSKIATPLSIFGGESSQFRSQVSKQRVALMEDEKDLLEAIAHAKTKAEKAELQKQLDALRAERRELERALR